MSNHDPSTQERIAALTTPNLLLDWQVYNDVGRFSAETIRRLTSPTDADPESVATPERVATGHNAGVA